jgi:hypothetical protein
MVIRCVDRDVKGWGEGGRKKERGEERGGGEREKGQGGGEGKE